MLQVLFSDVVCLLRWFSVFHMFLQLVHMHVSSVTSAFRHTLQVLHLDVLKVDRVWISVLAFCYLVFVSPPPGADWASVTPSSSSRCSAGPRGRNGAGPSKPGRKYCRAGAQTEQLQT
jgi:hypothetical protein